MRPGTILCGAAALCIGVAMTDTAIADPGYDRTIEQAAIKIVMRKLGPIRGTHAINEPFSLFPPAEARSVENGTLKRERTVRIIYR